MLADKLAAHAQPPQSFDHSKLTEPQWVPGFGPCVCEDCKRLARVTEARPNVLLLGQAARALQRYGEYKLSNALRDEAARWAQPMRGSQNDR